MCAVQGNVTVDVRAFYLEPISCRQSQNVMHEMIMYLCIIIFTFCMHLAQTYAEHARQTRYMNEQQSVR